MLNPMHCKRSFLITVPLVVLLSGVLGCGSGSHEMPSESADGSPKPLLAEDTDVAFGTEADGPLESAGPADGGSEVQGPVEVAATEMDSGSQAPGGGSTCMEAVTRLGKELRLMDVPRPQEVTVVMRLDYRTFAMKGYSVFSGTHTQSDLAATTERVQKDSGCAAYYGHSPQFTLESKEPQDEWVFSVAPIDLGCIAVVSARNGQLVFSAGTGLMVALGILRPATWVTTNLDAGCPALQEIPVRNYNMMTFNYGTPRFEEAREAALSTALAKALSMRGNILDAAILLYTPGVDLPTNNMYPEPAVISFDEAATEYIVFLNAMIESR